jgi:hypothetical protein
MRNVLLFLGLLVCGQLWGQELIEDRSVLRAYWEQNQQQVGGTLQLIVEQQAGANLTIKVDSSALVIPIGMVTDTMDPWIRQTYTFLATDSGEAQLSPVVGLGENGNYQCPVSTLLLSMVPADASVELAQERAIEHTSITWQAWLRAFWPYVLGSVLVILGLLFLIHRWKNRAKAKVPVLTPEEADPFKEALEQLARIREEKPWEHDAKAYYVELGDLVRAYLSYRTGLPLSEKTTSEAIHLVQNKWTGKQISSYQFIMTRADVVKFAKGAMGVEVHLDCLKQAETLVLEFKPLEKHD